jgi:UDP-3-O-[3-hydroxymyristoyl] glucosamine N-acyltransferase
MNNLLILGAGQFGLMVKEIAESMSCFDKIDFLDDNNEIAVGKLADYEKFAFEYRYAVVAIGNPEIRLSYIQKLAEACFIVAVIASPQAYIASSAQIMKGSIIEPMAVVQVNSVVAIGSIISSGAVVRHNAFVGDVCHVDCNAVVMSGSIVPAKTKIEACSVYRNII